MYFFTIIKIVMLKFKTLMLLSHNYYSTFINLLRKFWNFETEKLPWKWESKNAFIPPLSVIKLNVYSLNINYVKMVI